jgi:hypothetical protein
MSGDGLERTALKATTQSTARAAGSGPSGWSRILAESVLIVFSILLALFVDQWREGLRLDRLRDRAIADIHEEIENNRTAVDGVVVYHTAVRESLGNLWQRIERSGSSAQPGFDLIAGVARAGIRPPAIRRTAWETAISTDAVTLMDYSLIYRLGGLYDTQTTGVESTLARIQDFVFDPMLFEPARAGAAVRMIHALVSELAGQEYYLSAHYDSVLTDPAFAGSSASAASTVAPGAQ